MVDRSIGSAPSRDWNPPGSVIRANYFPAHKYPG
jgi:hypothetical protein